LERAPSEVYQPFHGTYPIIGWKYHSIEEANVGPAPETVIDTHGKPPRASREAVPEHLADLYKCDNCASSTERQVLAQLLMEYGNVFSRCDGDMG